MFWSSSISAADGYSVNDRWKQQEEQTAWRGRGGGAGVGESKCSNSRAPFQTPLQYHGHHEADHLKFSSSSPHCRTIGEVSSTDRLINHSYCVAPFFYTASSWRLYSRPLQMSYCCHSLLLSNSSDGFCWYILNQSSSSAPDLQDIIVLLGAAEIAQPTHELFKDDKKQKEPC